MSWEYYAEKPEPEKGDTLDLLAQVGQLTDEVARLLNKLADARTESMRLRAALEKIASSDVPRPVKIYWQSEDKPCKHDMCAHGMRMYEECADCLSEHARAALEGK